MKTKRVLPSSDGIEIVLSKDKDAVSLIQYVKYNEEYVTVQVPFHEIDQVCDWMRETRDEQLKSTVEQG